MRKIEKYLDGILTITVMIIFMTVIFYSLTEQETPTIKKVWDRKYPANSER